MVSKRVGQGKSKACLSQGTEYSFLIAILNRFPERLSDGFLENFPQKLSLGDGFLENCPQEFSIVTLREAKQGSAGVPVAKCEAAGDTQSVQEMTM